MEKGEVRKCGSEGTSEIGFHHQLTFFRGREWRDEGWVKADVPLEDGIADLNGFCVFPEEDYMIVNRSLNMLQQFHALPHHPNIIGLMERMMGAPVVPHAKTHSRFIFPQREEFTTPPHQDFILIQGNVDTYTAWFPIGDVSNFLSQHGRTPRRSL